MKNSGGVKEMCSELVCVVFAYSEANGRIRYYRDEENTVLKNPSIARESDGIAYMTCKNYREALQKKQK